MDSVTTFETLSSHTAGVTVVAVFAIISALALGFICGRTVRLGVKVLLQRDDEDTSRIPEMLFFSTQLGQYGASLVLSNVVITLSGLIAFKWISSDGVSAGSACQAQGILMQIGIWANCYFTVVHGIHTCNSLVLRLRSPRWLSAVVIAMGWAVALVAGLAPLHNRDAYGPFGVSCDIGSGNNKAEVFTLLAFPVILAAALSVIVYSVIFLALGGKLGLSGTDKLRKLNLRCHRGQDEFEEYRRFIRTIIQTMFWFPFAFVVLLLPICVAHIMMFSGTPVPYAFDVFAHVCCSLLGFANVLLLLNTYRVVMPIINGPKLATVKTFGDNASGESPISQKPQSLFLSKEPAAVPSYKRSTTINHGRSDSSSSADSSTELLKHQKSRKSSRGRVAHPRNILPPAELKRQIYGGTPMLQKGGSGIQGLVMVSLAPPPQRVFPVAEQPDSELLAKERKHLSRQTTLAFGNAGRQLSFKSKAPPPLDLPPLSMREVTNKSDTLAARLGVPPKPDSPAAAPTTIPDQQLDKGKGKAPPPPFTPLRKKSVVQRPSVVLEVRPSDLVAFRGHARSDSTSSTSSSVSGESLPNSDNEDVPVPDDSDYATDSDACSDLGTERKQERPMTMSSIWSRESHQTLNRPLEIENYLVIKELKAAARGGKAVVAGRQRAPAGPRGPSPRPLKLASKLSNHFSKMVAPTWSPAATRELEFKMVLAPNDSAV